MAYGNSRRRWVPLNATAASRRQCILVGGTVGAGVLTGCLGDDDEPVDDTDDDADAADDANGDDTDDIVPADDTDDADDADSEPADIERHDVFAAQVYTDPHPADAQYSNWSGDPTPGWSTHAQYQIMGTSFYDFEAYSLLLSDHSYEPGIIEGTFRDDVYWWSGDAFTVDDFLADLAFRDWLHGGDDLDYNPNMITVERVDDDSFRLALADTWAETWAYQQSLVEYPNPYSSRVWLEPWIEEFEDTGADMDAVEEVREDVSETRVEEDEELVHHYHSPFEFRLDGSIGDVTEEYWELELVPEKDGAERAYVDEINFRRLRHYVVEETDLRRPELFLAEEIPFTNFRHLELDLPEDQQIDDADDLPFPTHTIIHQRDQDRFCWNFNCEIEPTSNPHFRRAFAYMTPDEIWAHPPRREAQEIDSAWMTDERAERYVSEDVLSAFTSYGWEESLVDEAEAEMTTGGYERNGNGQWLDADGEPMEYTMGSYSWVDWIGDEGSDFFLDLDDFGIQIEYIPDTTDPWRMFGDYHGGVHPEFIFVGMFGDESLGWPENNNLPETVEAPEVGETNAPPEEWVEYDVQAMAERLGVTIDDEPYQDIVDQLAWVHNQIMPRYRVNANNRVQITNDNRWSVSTIEEAPEKWTQSSPRDQHYINGAVRYVPEEER